MSGNEIFKLNKSIDASDYVVFDVETNGLKSKEDDLLSISFYKPDDGKSYNRFLPLEMANRVKTSAINGITEDTLKEATPLTQEEFDKIIEEFELVQRTILTFSGRNFDEVFFREYLRRKRIKGFDRLTFYNFKNQIVSSAYSGGNVTKDNLCKMFNIPNVSRIHSSINDCRLEWELFKKLDGFYYLITEGMTEDSVFRMAPDYIIPVSYLSSHPKLSRIINYRPYLICKANEIKSFEIDASGLIRFETNFNGMIIEHLIDTMLNVHKEDSEEFLLENKSKLEFVGTIPSAYEAVPMQFNSDGTMSAVQRKDKAREKEINSVVALLKKRLKPLVEYIGTELFADMPIKSQELVINSDYNILALCDLSTEEAVLEIKTNNNESDFYKEQLFYEANGRKCYHLKMEWIRNYSTFVFEKVIFRIFEVSVEIGAPPTSNWTQERLERKKNESIQKVKDKLEPLGLELVRYTDSVNPIKVKCKNCGNEWETSMYRIKMGAINCETCNPKQIKPKKRKYEKKYGSAEDRMRENADKYAEKIRARSEGRISVSGYTGSKETVHATCNICGYCWTSRADHLVDRCDCPQCKKIKRPLA